MGELALRFLALPLLAQIQLEQAVLRAARQMISVGMVP